MFWNGGHCDPGAESGDATPAARNEWEMVALKRGTNLKWSAAAETRAG